MSFVQRKTFQKKETKKAKMCKGDLEEELSFSPLPPQCIDIWEIWNLFEVTGMRTGG